MTTGNDSFEDIKLKDVFDNLTQGIFLFDENDVIIIANQAFCDNFSVTKKEVEGQSLNTYLNNKNYKSKAIVGQHQSHDIELISSDGRAFLAEFRVLKNDAKNKLTYIGTILNRQNNKQLENELQQQIDKDGSFKDKLEEEHDLREMKSRFLSIASHEFRTPLAGILSSLNLISRYLEAEQETWFRFKNREKVINHLEKIKESVKNLTTILQKFLALGNIQRGEIPVKYINFDLKKTIAKQVTQFKQICKSGQKITYSHEGRKVMVSLDKYLLKNIMNNLLSNAIKFSPENSIIKVLTSISNKEISITVEDKGIGIPQLEQSKIFRRFFRAKNALTYDEGTGLGLNIVRKYVELLNGKIYFESEENRGTIFKITFTYKNK